MWYKHNPGGKKAKRAPLSEEQINNLLSLPSPEFSRRRKKYFRGTKLVDQAHMSSRQAGSSSVRTMVYAPPSCDTYENMYLGRS